MQFFCLSLTPFLWLGLFIVCISLDKGLGVLLNIMGLGDFRGLGVSLSWITLIGDLSPSRRSLAVINLHCTLTENWVKIFTSWYLSYLSDKKPSFHELWIMEVNWVLGGGWRCRGGTWERGWRTGWGRLRNQWLLSYWWGLKGGQWRDRSNNSFSPNRYEDSVVPYFSLKFYLMTCCWNYGPHVRQKAYRVSWFLPSYSAP